MKLLCFLRLFRQRRRDLFSREDVGGEQFAKAARGRTNGLLLSSSFPPRSMMDDDNPLVAEQKTKRVQKGEKGSKLPRGFHSVC